MKKNTNFQKPAKCVQIFPQVFCWFFLDTGREQTYNNLRFTGKNGNGAGRVHKKEELDLYIFTKDKNSTNFQDIKICTYMPRKKETGLEDGENSEIQAGSGLGQKPD